MPSFKGYSSPWPVSTFVGDEFLLEKKPVSHFDWNRIYALKKYQIRYGKVKVSFAVVFRLKTGIQSRQMRDEISCDRKYVL